MNSNSMFFIFSLLTVVVCCGYLILAKCYQTGLLGAIGLGIVAMAAYSFLTEHYYADGYKLLPQTMWTYIGICLFLVQHVYRVIRSAICRRRKADARMGALK